MIVEPGFYAWTFHYRVQAGPGVHTAIYVVGTRGPIYLDRKRPERQAGYVSPHSAEQKYKRLYTTTPRKVFRAWF
jgi:hypothetical protein